MQSRYVLSKTVFWVVSPNPWNPTSIARWRATDSQVLRFLARVELTGPELSPGRVGPAYVSIAGWNGRPVKSAVVVTEFCSVDPAK
jgi:hypothetical protein